MRRFVQALSGLEGIPGGAPAMIARLRTLPDRWNISRGQAAGVMVGGEDGLGLQVMAWGLVPSWEPLPETRYSTQTARLDRAPRSRLYRRAWQQRRCAVPMNGYFKWSREQRPHRPWFIQARDGVPLFAAALWERWHDDELGLEHHSFAILTQPNPTIPAPLTADGPLFLAPRRVFDWIAADPRRALAVTQRDPPPALEAYPVSRRIARRDVDDYTLLEPLPPDGEDGLGEEVLDEDEEFVD
jgi:putative SOS response-associated peptidase YedK